LNDIVCRPAHEIYIGNYPVRFRESDVRKLFEDHGVKVLSIRLKHDGQKV
jgi:RNA recognition motif-containing protein